MLHKSIYQKLLKECFVNIACDGQQMTLLWDIDSKLKRAPLLCIPRFFKTIDEAMKYAGDNPGCVQGYHGFTAFEETCLSRYNSISTLEPYEVEALERHNKVCPLCGRAY